MKKIIFRKSISPSTTNTQAKKGFTLIELLVVIAIIGLLSSVVIASLNTAREKARDARRLSDARQTQNALELYASSNNGKYPQTPQAGQVGNLTSLVPSYISELPQDPTRTGVSNYRYHSGPNNDSYTLLVDLEQDGNGHCKIDYGPGFDSWEQYPDC